MKRTSKFLLVLLMAAFCAFHGGCDDALDSVEETPRETASLPPPPPPAAAGRPPVVTPAAPDPAPTVTTETDEETEEEIAEEDPLEEELIAFPAENETPQARALTPREARAAIEDLGGRVSLDDAGNAVKVFLNRTSVGDDEIDVIQYLPELQILNLTGTSVSDDGLRHAHGLSKLQRVYAAHSDVSDEGARQLQEAVPDCEVYR